MMYPWAKPGAKVICIDDRWPPNSWYGWEFLPCVGEIYTVRETLVVGGHAGLRLVEISNPKADYMHGFIEPAFSTARFRPSAPKSNETGSLRTSKDRISA